MWLPGHLKLSVAHIRGLHCSHWAAVVQATVMLEFLLSLVFTSCFLSLQVSSSYLQLSNFGDGARWPPRWSSKASGSQGSHADPWWPRTPVAESRSQGDHGGGHTSDGCLWCPLAVSPPPPVRLLLVLSPLLSPHLLWGWAACGEIPMRTNEGLPTAREEVRTA